MAFKGTTVSTVERNQKVFDVTGMFPVDWNFPEKFKTKNEAVKEAARVEKVNIGEILPKLHVFRAL